jgi:hypothetical protein
MTQPTTHTAAPKPAPKDGGVGEPTREQRITTLIDNYQHGLNNAAPRTLAELTELRALLAPAIDQQAKEEPAPPLPEYNPIYERAPTPEERAAKKAATEKAIADKAAADKAAKVAA